MKGNKIRQKDELTGDHTNIQIEGGYEAVNQKTSEVNQYINDDFRNVSFRDKCYPKILINICIIGTITLLLFIAFTIIYKTDQDEIDRIFPFRKDQIDCPEQYQFSPVSLKCERCSSSCLYCQPGAGESNPCLQCAVPFSLFGEDCVKTCPLGYQNYEGICLQDKQKRFSSGRLKINNTNHSVIDFMVYLPEYFVKKVVFLIPPVGSNQLYYCSQTDLSQFVDSTDAAIITFSTPIQLVVEMVPQDQRKGNGSHYPFVKIIADQLLLLLDLNLVEQYFYVGLSDSIIIGLQLSNYIIKPNMSSKIYHTLVLLQTQNTTLNLTLNVDPKELVIVLDYINDQYATKNTSQLEKYQHLRENSTMNLTKQFNTNFSQEVIKSSARNQDLEIILLNELSANSELTVTELQLDRKQSVIVVNTTMSDSQEQQKIQYLISKLLLDVISQQGSWLERQGYYGQL